MFDSAKEIMKINKI